MRNLNENNNGVALIVVGFILAIIAIVIMSIFFMDMLIFIILGGIIMAILYVIIRFAPMPYKLYGSVGCVISLVAIFIYLFVLG